MSEKKEKKQKKKHKSKAVRNGILLGGIAALLCLGIGAYFLLIPFTIRSAAFWWEWIVITVVFAVGCRVPIWLEQKRNGKRWGLLSDRRASGEMGRAEVLLNRGSVWLPVVLAVLLVVLSFFSSKLLNAKRYASVLAVTEADFETDLSETLDTDAIALMDTASAKKLGDREIGSLSEVVSQYNVSSDYVQIDLGGSPIKVSALDYAGFFKWMANKDNGVPGYVVVNPVSMSAEYEELAQAMRYVPSAYFWEDADRYLFLHYPTKLLGSAHFEVDETGAPYYIAPIYAHTIGLFGGTTVTGILLLNPVTGEITEYALSEVPAWADYVFDGDLLCTQYDWLGQLTNGFWNAVFAKKGCKKITVYAAGEDEDEETEDAVPANDYGYIAKDGDIWIYTGVTSVNNDSSNIGFLLANQRTGEARYYAVSGADERSAMDAAEGEVQEKGYQASFPSLINVEGNPTYIMVLKDVSGLVKLYAAVNVEQYNYVTTASTQEECIEKYKTLLNLGEETDASDSAKADDSADEDAQDSALERKDVAGETDLLLAAVRYIAIEGNTWIYLVAEDGTAYHALASENESMMVLEAGDSVHISYTADREIVSCQNK